MGAVEGAFQERPGVGPWAGCPSPRACVRGADGQQQSAPDPFKPGLGTCGARGRWAQPIGARGRAQARAIGHPSSARAEVRLAALKEVIVIAGVKREARGREEREGVFSAEVRLYMEFWLHWCG